MQPPYRSVAVTGGTVAPVSFSVGRFGVPQTSCFPPAHHLHRERAGLQKPDPYPIPRREPTGPYLPLPAKTSAGTAPGAAAGLGGRCPPAGRRAPRQGCGSPSATRSPGCTPRRLSPPPAPVTGALLFLLLLLLRHRLPAPPATLPVSPLTSQRNGREPPAACHSPSGSGSGSSSTASLGSAPPRRCCPAPGRLPRRARLAPRPSAAWFRREPGSPQRPWPLAASIF